MHRKKVRRFAWFVSMVGIQVIAAILTGIGVLAVIKEEDYIMNLSVILIEIVIMMVGFTVLVFGMLFISPLTFISDYPPEIQAEYYRSQHKEATKENLTRLMVLKKLIAVVVFLFLFAWMLHLAGVKTFWQGVGLTLIYMLCVFAWDPFFLDWVLFAVLAGFISSGLMLWIW